MSEITSILAELHDTREAEVLSQMEAAYENVVIQQDKWYKTSCFLCPEGCGECCRNFEPDLLECEALYMAAWIIENQPETAKEVAEGTYPFPQNNGCPFWDESKEYHCTIYGGRPCICRFFGGCGSRAKNGETVWKPCKFYPAEKLAVWKVPLNHRQYSETEVKNIFGTLPPVMNDLMEGVIGINPDNKQTILLKEILPETIKRLLWIRSLNS